MIHALTQAKNLILNKGNAFLDIYYDLTKLLFVIQSKVAQIQETEESKINPEQDDEVVDPSSINIFGDKECLKDFKDFEDYQMDWIQNLFGQKKNMPMEAVHIFIQLKHA